MLSTDLDPEVIAGWYPFFTLAGSAAAPLAGLLFIALSIHAREVATHPAFRYRALATLVIPLVVLAMSGIALLPKQTGRVVGLAELLPPALQLVGLFVSYRRALGHGPMAPAYRRRTAVGGVLIGAAMVGAGALALGSEVGLVIIAVFCLASLTWMAYNSWALLFAIADAERAEGVQPDSPEAGAQDIMGAEFGLAPRGKGRP